MTCPVLLLRALKKRQCSGGFGIEILYPGLAKPGDDSGLGAIGRIDHARVTAGTVIGMHPHRDDEILTYLRRGMVRHRDSPGHLEEITPTRLMLMHAGHRFDYEEEVLEGPLEALQIFLRPRAADLDPLVQFHDFGAALSEGAWRLVAAPEGAPQTVRGAAWVQDRHFAAAEAARPPPPPVAGAVRLLYLFAGRARVEGTTFEPGESLLLGAVDYCVEAEASSDLVLFTTDPGAEVFRGGMFSGNTRTASAPAVSEGLQA